MRSHIHSHVFAFALAAIVVAVAVTPAAGAKPASKAVRLFNGKDLSSFYVFVADKEKGSDPDGVFKVENGALHVSGRAFGYIATREEFENYHLVVEYRWGEKTWPPREAKARDSGILFHTQGDDKIWPASIELNIIEGGTGDLILVGGTSIDFHESLRPHLAKPDVLSADGKRVVRGRINFPGRAPDWQDVRGFRGARDLEKPVGQWNRAEVIADGDRFTFVVNGTTTLRATGAQPARGRIVLQSEGAELFFRRVDLTPLVRKTATAPRPRAQESLR